MKKEKTVCIAVAVIALLGFATGWNYESEVSENIFDCAKNCFEFGMLPFLLGKNITDCIKASFLSLIKNLIPFAIGGILFYPIIPISLFSLFFKSGLVFRYISKHLKSDMFFGALMLLCVLLAVSIYFALISVKFTYFRLSYKKRKNLNTEDLRFFKNTGITMLSVNVFAVFVFTVLLLCKNGLHGIFNTYI